MGRGGAPRPRGGASTGQTAITVADALQNFMRTGLIGDDFHTRTRLVGEKEV